MPTDPTVAAGVLNLLSTNVTGSSCLDTLDGISAELANDIHFREQLGRSAQIWSQLSLLWKSLQEFNQNMMDDEGQRQKTLTLSRFTRNLVAGCPENQIAAFQCEPSIRELIFFYTSYALTMDETMHKLVRFLGQTLSNIVTTNDGLLSTVWSKYATAPEEQSILLRMLTHPDDSVAVVALILAFNCLATNKERMQMLAETPTGKRFCIVLLDKLAFEVQDDDETHNSEFFEIGWRIFEAMLDNNLAHSLMTLTLIDKEPTSPHRTTFLKILDSYLLRTLTTNTPSKRTEADEHDLDQLLTAIAGELLPLLIELIDYANLSLERSIGSLQGSANGPSTGSDRTSASQPPLNYDVLLPKVCESIVLVVQSFCTLSLAKNDDGPIALIAHRTMKLLTDSLLPRGVGVIEGLIELLRLLDEFVPRVMFGKASWSTPRPGVPLPPPTETEERGFSYVKRDVVRLIGILCYENRAVQDRVRLCGGITAVMNLCITDERNPYLREHALFALRNLLEGNAENQAVVDAIKPMGAWDENGVLRDLPGVRK